MKASEMLLCNANLEKNTLIDEAEIVNELLPLSGARVVELGCGAAELTRVMAKKAAHVLAFEVDEAQLAANQTIENLPNVQFAYGGAEKIQAPDDSVDIVVMLKSLHHVPAELHDAAFAEIFRVLKPNGVAYISEPIAVGVYDALYRLFNDEVVVREAAFSAVKRAVESGKFRLLSQTFFDHPVPYRDFAELEEELCSNTYNDYDLSHERIQQAKAIFDAQLSGEEKGLIFPMHMRVDLLQK